MLKWFEKYWSIISLLFIIAILSSLFFWPSITQPLSLIVMCVGFAVIITFTTQRQVQAHRQGKITRQVLVRNIVVDVLGIFIAMTAAIFIVVKVAAVVALAAGEAWGVTAGIISSLAAGLAAGFGVSLLVRWIWDRLTKPGRPMSAGSAR